MEEFLKDDMRETLINHYGYSPEDAEVFIINNIDDMLATMYQALSEELMNLVNEQC